MTRRASNRSRSPAATRALDLALLLVIALGVGLRWEGLDRRPLWYDEVGTALRVSGNTEGDVAALYDGRPLPARELLHRFQDAADGPLVAGMARVVHAVAVDEPPHSPGYFVAAYAWARLAGNGRAALRALSALASTVALLLLGLLAWRLFAERDVALATLALAAVSPLQVRYAHEARAYAVWAVALLATALAVRAASATRSRAAWAGVALAFAMALYVHPLSLLAAPALLALASAAPRIMNARANRGAVRAAAGAVAAAIALWAPWALVVLANRDTSARTTAWMGDSFALGGVVRSWLGVATSLFFRPSGAGGLLGEASFPGASLLWVALGLLAAALVVLALAAVARRAAPAPRRFVPALALVPFAALALADLLIDGRRSTVDRYLVPSWLAVELAVAFLLAARGPHTRLRHAVLLAVLALGAATALRSRPLDVWWNTEPEALAELRDVGARLAASDDPIVLTDVPPLRVLELAHRLDAAATVRLGPEAPDRLAADDWARAVLVRPSPALLARAQRAAGSGRALVQDAGTALWRVAPAQ